jgi:hypothetical protein
MPNKIISFFNHAKFIYLTLIVLVILDRLFIYSNFNSKFLGSDDMVFWQGAHDYMNGHFHVPYFYGQNYNVMLESFFAIPFLELSVPYHLAFFLSTSIITLFPFFMFSIVFWRKGFVSEALFFVIIPLLLPIDYGIITSISRGFVNGLFFSSFYVFALVYPEKKSSWIIAAFAAAIGHFVNPSIIVVTLPVFTYLFLVNFKKIPFYLYSMIIILPVLFLQWKIKEWYSLHPEINLCPMLILEFDKTMILQSFNDLDSYFSWITPLVWPAGWLILPIGLIAGILLTVKKDKEKGVAVIIGILFIVVSLGVNKIHQSLSSILFSAVRMYLGIPIFTGIMFFWLRPLFSKITNRQFSNALLCIAICTFFIKSSLYSMVVDKHTKRLDIGMVAINRRKDVECECDKIKKIAVENKIDLVVTIPSWDTLSSVPMREFLAYGCPLLKTDFPSIILNVYEKRFWLYQKEKKSVRKNILFYGGPTDVDYLKTIKNCTLLNDKSSQSIYMITDNTLTLDSLCRKLNVSLFRK